MDTDFRLKPPPQHSENQTVRKRCSELLDQVKDKASLIPLRSVHQTEIRVKACFNNGPPNFAVEDSVSIVQTLIDWISRRSCYAAVQKTHALCNQRLFGEGKIIGQI